MKKIITLSFLAFAFTFSVFSQSVPNGGFENWTTTGNYSNPNSWDTPNATTAAIPFVGAAVVSKSNGAHTGSWCAKLENKNFIALCVPGIMTLGTFSIDLLNQNFSLSGGAPYNQRPDVFKGFYKYSPQGGDTCAFVAMFFKYNQTTGQDTIGIAFFMSDTAKTSWSAFETPIFWFNNDVPDTMNIIASSAASLSPTAGSVLYVDDLSYDYYTGITEVKTTDPISIDYKSISRTITVNLDLNSESEVISRVINLTGQTVRQKQLNVNGQKSFTINMEDQSKGMYIVEVKAGDVKKVKKIVLN